MENESEYEFLSKLKGIRSKNLRNFLSVYFYAYILDPQESNPLITKGARERMQKKPPRVFPGLRIIRRYLACSKATAQDYLRAVQITKEILTTRNESVHSQIQVIQKEKYEQLLRDLMPIFETISKELTFDEESLPSRRTKPEIRQWLRYIANQVFKQGGAFTGEECARIFQELANCLL